MQTQFKISSDKTSMYLRNALLQMKLITPKHIKRDPLDGSMYLETATTRLRVQVKNNEASLYYDNILLAETHKTEGIQVNTSALQSLLGNSLNAKLELITEHHQAQNLNRFLTDSPKTRTANLTSAKGILTEKELQDLSPYMVDILNVDAGKRNHFLKIISRHRIQNENAKPGEYAFTNPFLTNTCLLFSEGIPVDDFLCLDEKDQVGFATQAKQVIALLKNGMGAETLMQTGAEGLIKIRENLGSEISVLYNGNKEAKAIVINNAISLLSELTKQSGACPTPF